MSIGRTRYATQTDSDAVNAFKELSQLEGIMPALEPAHAISYATKLAKTLGREDSIIVNLSGRGDKDVDMIARQFPQ
jgi:tryptophan synthase beta subunit